MDSKTKPLIFFGTNSVLERHLDACSRLDIRVHGIIDKDWYGNRTDFCGIPVLDSEDIFATNADKYRDYCFFVAVNWNPMYRRDFYKRRKFIELIRQHQLSCINLIDPQSYVSPSAQIGMGVFIGAHVTVEPRVVIGDFVSVWNNSVILHDTIIGENSVLQRQTLVQAKKIGHDTYIGFSVSVVKKFDITIGSNVIIEPCLHVCRNVDDNENVRINRNPLRIYRRGGEPE